MYQLEYARGLYDKADELRAGAPANVLQKIKKKLENIAKQAETYPHKHLKGRLAGFYKVKWADFRVIYSLDHARRVMTVHRIDHRSTVYGKAL
jgi:mRNA interferase RelE/StbE